METSQTQSNSQLQKIDSQLDVLVQITAQMSTLAKAIGVELCAQNEMISDLNTQMDKTQTKLNNLNKQVREVRRRT
jgi:predicted  nucleic acid-binding Zn-ribbon protein